MHRSQTSQFNLAQIKASKQSDHECLVNILQKPEKTKEDAKVLFEKIKNSAFFQNFFAHYIKDLDMHSILSLCQTFQYEKFEANSVVIKQREPNNDKYYVILSGEVGVIIKNDMLGQFGDIDPSKKSKEGSDTDKSMMSIGSVREKRKKTLTLLVSSNSMSPKSRNSLQRPRTASLSSSQSIEPKSAQLKSYPKSIFSQRAGILVPNEPDSPYKSDNEPVNQGKSESYYAKSNLASIFKTKAKILMGINPKLVLSARNKMKELQEQRSSVTINLESCQSFDLDITSERAGERTPRTPRVNSEESQEDDPDYQFKQESLNYGRIIRYLKEGEGFGEIALKRNIPRTATILCKTDCEMLIIQKEQYELGFGKMQWEKEEFLNSVFTLLKTSIASTQNYNYLIYSFKTQRYPRGTYLLTEGKTTDQDPKFYVVQHGECLVEKQILKEIADPYDPQKTLVSRFEKVQITVASKGVIVGEEILFTEDEYEYSIKVSSETVIVQAITKNEYAQRFPKEFQDYIRNIYDKKRHHRETVFEQIKKDESEKTQRYRSDSVYSLKNRDMKDYVMKPSLHGFSRYINRESKLYEEKDVRCAELHTPRKQPKIDPEGVITVQKEEPNAPKPSPRAQEDLHKQKKEKELLNRFGVDPDQNNKILARIQFLNNMPKKAAPNLDDITEVSLFLTKNKSQGFEANRNANNSRPSSAKVTKGMRTLSEIVNPMNPMELLMNKVGLINKDSPPQTAQRPSTASRPTSALQSPRSARIADKKKRENSEEAPKVKTMAKCASSLTVYSPSMRPGSAKTAKESIILPSRPGSGRPISRESLKKNLFITGITTEPQSRYKLDVGSLNFLQAKSPKSPKIDLESMESPSHCLMSISSVSIIPGFMDRLITSPNAKQSGFYGDKNNKKMDDEIQVLATPTTACTISASLRSLHSKKNSVTNVHVQEKHEWRQKVFKKPTRKTSASSIPASYNTTPR